MPSGSSVLFLVKVFDVCPGPPCSGALGLVVAYAWTIEFQKRGLPHLHLLIIVRPEDKVRSPADVDARVCAELPDARDPSQRDLAEIIVGGMVHGPCGKRNPKAPCMVDGCCSKGYPKEFAEETTLPDNAYPKYRRRNNGRTAIKGNHVVDNRDVVPYNPGLSKKYQCHSYEGCFYCSSCSHLFC